MTKNGKRRNSSVEHRSTKRRKSSDHQQPVYSTRIITWEEQLRLPARFREERNVWPALKILEERGIGKRKEYLLEWETHPTSGEIFEPTWEPSENVGQELKSEWKRRVQQHSQVTDSQQSFSLLSSHASANSDVLNAAIGNRRAQNRRIIPDSSGDIEDITIQDSEPSRTPTLIGSPGSDGSITSPIEISETQLPQQSASVRVNVPPVPVDKNDWETLRESQLTAYQTSNQASSPLVNSLLPLSSSSTHQTPTQFAQQSSPSSLRNISTGSSSSLVDRNRGHNVRRILDYSVQSTLPSLAGDFLQFSSAPAQQDQAEIGLAQYKSSLQSPPQLDIAVQSNTSEERSSKDSHQVDDNQSIRAPPGSSESLDRRDTQSWAFKSQISADLQGEDNHRTFHIRQSSLSGRCARKTSNPASQEQVLCFANSGTTRPKLTGVSPTGMATRGTRQSPRLQTSTPHSATSPRIAVRTGSFRARSGFNPPEHSSPLAATAEQAESEHLKMPQDNPDSSFINGLPADQSSSGLSMIPPTSIAPSAMHIDPSEATILGPLSQGSTGYDTALNILPTPVQESIEDETISSVEEASLASKASSSQESLRNERIVPQVDGLVMPTYPILGQGEYAIALPAEGKVQAIYMQTLKVKRRAILKFIRRRGSVNTASTSTNKTVERNEMIELIGRLNDTTTHIDLGLPGIPTQYTIPSQEHAAYANYAGSKFVFLGYLLDYLQRRQGTFVIMTKSGATQDLLEEYLTIKRINVRRHDRAQNSQSSLADMSPGPQVVLLSTKPHKIVEIDEKPNLIIAFDSSFEALDPQVRSLRSRADRFVPIVHLLVTNSSEHVDRCLPPSMPSPVRLRLLVRATFQASQNLGGSPTIITNPSDELDGRPMDLGDISRAVRKSPNRKLQMVAAVVANATLSDDFESNWTLNSMPELVLDPLDDSPSTGSTVSTTPGRSRNRSQTPLSRAAGQIRNRSQTPASRATTPSAKKRQLEIDTVGLAQKRQRMTPVNETFGPHDSDVIVSREQELNQLIDSLRVELANERRARVVAEEAKNTAEKKAAEWHSSLTTLQRRYEKRTTKSKEQHKANKSLSLAIENSKVRTDRVTTENTSLRQQVAQHKKELEAARNDLKSAGGEIAAIEAAREEARNATTRSFTLEKSLENTKRDFEFLRNQYQEASSRAAELGSQVTALEDQVNHLSQKATDEKRRLKEMNASDNVKQHLAKISQLEAEKKSILVMYKRLEEESKLLKRNRGVQTRGSSTAPGSPGQRSRQGSPALVAPPPSGSRASVLRHER